MADWRYDEVGGWRHPDRQLPSTTDGDSPMFDELWAALMEAPRGDCPREFKRDDGSIYERHLPDEFPAGEVL